MQQPGDNLVEYGARRWLIVAGVMSATLLQVLDATIVNVALPTIQGNLGANFDDGAWIVTAYIIAAVIVIPLTPWLQQLFGRREYYVAAIVGFTITSALCGLATSLDELIFFRVLQGLCGGGLIATGQAIMRDTFPAKELGKSQALVSLGAIVGPSIGPTLGGVLTDAISWNWIFYVNIVPGIISALLCAMLLRNPPKRGRPSVDAMGLGLLALGLGSLQYLLDEGERYDWFNDGTITAIAVTAVGALASFVYWELRVVKNPIVDLRILVRNRTVAAGCLLAMTLAFGLFGGVILAPQFQQSLLNFSATLSGLSILVRALAIMLMTPVILVLLNRLHLRPQLLLGIGFAIVAVANILTGQVLTTQSAFGTFVCPSVPRRRRLRNDLRAALGCRAHIGAGRRHAKSHLAAESLPATRRIDIRGDAGDATGSPRRIPSRHAGCARYANERQRGDCHRAARRGGGRDARATRAAASGSDGIRRRFLRPRCGNALTHAARASVAAAEDRRGQPQRHRGGMRRAVGRVKP